MVYVFRNRSHCKWQNATDFFIVCSMILWNRIIVEIKKCDNADLVNIIIKFVVIMMKYLISILFCIALLSLSDNNTEEHLVRFMSDESVLCQGAVCLLSRIIYLTRIEVLILKVILYYSIPVYAEYFFLYTLIPEK